MADPLWKRWKQPTEVLQTWETELSQIPIDSSIVPGSRPMFTKPRALKMAALLFVWAFAVPLLLSSGDIASRLHVQTRRCLTIFAAICRTVLQRPRTEAKFNEYIATVSPF